MTTSEMNLPASLHYVSFPSLHDTPLTIAARMRVPQHEGKLPAVVLLHGSAGPSAREGGYADMLNMAGFATLEPDQWAARGIVGGAEGRPKSVTETLPDLYGARAFLAKHPKIDADRIGVAGFSFGGVAAMLAACHAHNDKFLPGGAFRAIMPTYPSTWLFNRVPGFEFGDLVDAPVMLVTGALDQYDNDAQVSAKLVEGLRPADRKKVCIEVMADAHHGFDMPGVDVEVNDPFGNQGKGGSVIMRHNPEATAKAHLLTAAFFASTMRPR
ncbi:MAG: dienelactone hydrolase family protein [Parvibaculum sedimenti]|uniref:dienelactone hydrolase family protein n=1 Tax=Parvibaculum sedimenti TaxID=2608632 RepID=UPI003BB66252